LTTVPVDIVFLDGSTMSILCNVIEDTMDLSAIQRSEFDRLVYEHPLEFVELLLTNKLEGYLKGYAKDYQSQKDKIREKLIKDGCPPSQADTIAHEFMRYDN